MLGNLTSTNPKEVGFQILLINRCKEANMFFSKCSSLLWLVPTVEEVAFFIQTLNICLLKKRI
jgi:hypothetical protein